MKAPTEETLLIDDFSDPLRASIGTQWRYFSDTVMGGVSKGSAQHLLLGEHHALQLRGNVSLDNNGGFIQAAVDLTASGQPIDAGEASGIVVCLSGDGGSYAINLRTADTQRPWQSYRRRVESTREWTTHYLPFEEFAAHRIDKPLNCHRLRRVGLIAIGDPGPARVAISRLAFYRGF